MGGWHCRRTCREAEPRVRALTRHCFPTYLAGQDGKAKEVDEEARRRKEDRAARHG